MLDQGGVRTGSHDKHLAILSTHKTLPCSPSLCSCTSNSHIECENTHRFSGFVFGLVVGDQHDPSLAFAFAETRMRCLWLDVHLEEKSRVAHHST